MSTTRWIIETGCADHDIVERHGSPEGSEIRGSIDCPGGSRVVVDPDNLPPEAIQRALVAYRLARRDLGLPWSSMTSEKVMEAAVRAFLSDPESGDQT